MTAVRTAVRGFRAAVVLLTRFPGGGFPFTDDEWRWATAAYPLVGAGIGIVLSGVWWLATPLGPLPCALATYGASLFVTGALHEDGLADSADALGGATTRERLFAILKDSRVGTYGVLALILSITLRSSLLARLGAAAMAGLVLSQALARLAPAYLMATLPYVTPADSRSREVVRVGGVQVMFASGSALVILAAVGLLGGVDILEGLGMVAGLVLVVVLCGRLFERRAGGITGDFLGASEQVGEAAVLIAMVMV